MSNRTLALQEDTAIHLLNVFTKEITSKKEQDFNIVTTDYSYLDEGFLENQQEKFQIYFYQKQEEPKEIKQDDYCEILVSQDYFTFVFNKNISLYNIKDLTLAGSMNLANQIEYTVQDKVFLIPKNLQVQGNMIQLSDRLLILCAFSQKVIDFDIIKDQIFISTEDETSIYKCEDNQIEKIDYLQQKSHFICVHEENLFINDNQTLYQYTLTNDQLDCRFKYDIYQPITYASKINDEILAFNSNQKMNFIQIKTKANLTSLTINKEAHQDYDGNTYIILVDCFNKEIQITDMSKIINNTHVDQQSNIYLSNLGQSLEIAGVIGLEYPY